MITDRKPLKVDFGVLAFGNFKTASAQKYYRVGVPLSTMYDLGLANVYAVQGEQDADLLPKLMCNSDVVQVWGGVDENALQIATLWKEAKPIQQNGKFIAPPLFIMDMDDAIEHVYPFNQVFSHYGIRDWDGRILSPGDSITWPKPDGTTLTLWEDKKTKGWEGQVFDIERNLKTIGRHYDIARAASGVTVTTPALKELFEYQGCENVYVFPNSVIPKDHRYPNFPDRASVRLLWEGGGSHMDSWFTIRRPFVDFMKRHPEVTFVVFGNVFPWMTAEIPESQLEVHGWVDYAAYKQYRGTLDADINLCPLFDHPFTRAKSAIRWYEASLGPKPEATLAANVGPYKEIEHGKTGLLYNTPEEFVEQLEGLVRNTDLRRDLGAGAKDWVLANRTAETTVPGLVEFYKELKARQRQEALAV